MKWISVKDRLPKELKEDFHSRQLLIETERFGTMKGFFMNGTFWISYAAELKEVSHWMLIPKPPEN